MRHWLLALLVLIGSVASQTAAEAITNDSAVVIFHGRELFTVSNISSVSADKRVETLLKRIREQAKSPLVSTDDFTVYNDDELHVSAIMSGADVVCWVMEADARQYGMPRAQLAEVWRKQIKDIIDQYRRDYTRESYIKGAIFAVIATAVLIVLWLLVRWLIRREMSAVEKRLSGRQMLKFVDGNSLVTINNSAFRIVRTVLFLALLVFYLNVVLSFFPWTFNLSAHLFKLISNPFINFGHAFVQNLPNLFALLVIGIIVRYFLRSLNHVFNQVGEGRVRIRGFYPDWADPTYRLIRLFILAFAVVMAFPYIPGSSSPAFKGVSIFVGVLFSLGSTSAVGNVIGGLMLTYMRSFSPGDFVEINGMRGTVMSRMTFATRLKTPTNEIISIPNSSVSSNHIINFSNMTKSVGVNIGTTVTIGYAVPWRTVHELLLKSAEGVEDVLATPAPMILQLKLEDFYIQYKLVVTTKRPERMYRILSDLHQNIQDTFAEAGVEIMSPHYRANRDGEAIAIPSAPGGPVE